MSAKPKLIHFLSQTLPLVFPKKSSLTGINGKYFTWMKCLMVFFFKEFIIRKFLTCARKEKSHYHTTYRPCVHEHCYAVLGQAGNPSEKTDEDIECGIWILK